MIRAAQPLLLATVALAATLTGCDGAPSALKESDAPPLVGRIAAAYQESGRSGVMELLIDRIEDPRPIHASGPVVYLTVLESTQIRVRRPDGSLGRGSPASLTAGASVRTWHTGIVLLSSPPIHTATRIEVTPGQGTEPLAGTSLR